MDKAAAALAAAAAMTAPRVRIRAIPGGRAVHTPEAAVKYNASAIRKAEKLTLKITQAHAQLDHLKAKRNTATCSFDEAAQKYKLEIIDQGIKVIQLADYAESIDGEIGRLQDKVRNLQAQYTTVRENRNQVVKVKTATELLLQAAQQKAKEVAAQDQPKIDQLTKTRDKLIERLYHHQLLHPGCLPEKASTQDAKRTDAREDSEAIGSATPAGSDQG